MSRSPKRASSATTATLPGSDQVDDTHCPIPRLAYRMKDLAEALGVSARTIERERSAGRFPPPDLKIGKVPLWRPETVSAWIAAGGAK